jgi:acylphosphatase
MAKFYAENLQLCGLVSNLPDGAVKICAQGPKERLEKLIDRLKKEFGPRLIDDVEISFSPITEIFENFQIC